MHKGIYKDNKNTWYIHTTIKGKTVTIRGFSSKRDAEENYEIAIDKWKRNHNVDQNKHYFSQVVDEFLEYRSKRVANETAKKDKMYINMWKTVFTSQSLSTALRIDNLRVIYNNLISNKDYTDTKKYRYITCFNELVSYCYMMNYISADTFNSIKVLFVAPKLNRQSQTNKRYISQTQINGILKRIKADGDNLFYLAVSVLYSCGLRISELLGLLGGDVDLAHKKIKVQRQLMTNGQLTTQLKTSNSYRSVPINQDLLNQLELNNLAKNRLFPFSHTDFRRKLSQYTDYTAHEFRHSFCTNLARKCSNIADVTYCAKVSGHTVSMFLNTYCKSLDDELENKFFG